MVVVLVGAMVSAVVKTMTEVAVGSTSARGSGSSDNNGGSGSVVVRVALVPVTAVVSRWFPFPIKETLFDVLPMFNISICIFGVIP